MHDEDAFLRAIQAEPKNDLRKLVYADWLEEQGRAGEAAFVRETTAGYLTMAYTHWNTPDPRIGKAWWDIFSGAVPMWDARTMLALGRLQGLLDGFATGTHGSRISITHTRLDCARLPAPLRISSVVRSTLAGDWS